MTLVICLGAAPLSPISPARADLVIEAYVDKRPADADRALAPLRAALEEAGHVVAPAEVAAALAGVAPGSGVSDAKLTAEAIASQVDVGVKSFVRGEFTVAAAQLREAIAAAHDNPALVVSDDKSPHWMTRGLTALALARAKLKDPRGAAEAMAEQLRSFPSLPVTVEEFGADGSELYATTRRAVEAQGRGGLTINVTDPNARIFVNELGRGRGSVALGDIAPGSYRVLVQASAVSRRYAVEISAGATAELTIDWITDSAFVFTPEWVGFALPRAYADRADAYAGRLAKALPTGNVITLGVTGEGSARQLTAAVHEHESGRVIGRAALPPGVTSPSARQLRDFLRALANELPAGAQAGAPASSRPPPAKVARWPIYLFAGLALAAAGGAVALRDEEDLFPAMVVGAAGFGVAAVGITFDVRARSRRATVALHPTASGGVATVGWRY